MIASAKNSGKFSGRVLKHICYPIHQAYNQCCEKPPMTDNNQSSLVTVNVGEIIGTLWDGKWIITSITTVCAIGAVFYALSLPNIYSSTTRLTQAEQSSSSLSSLMKQYAGLASVAGLSLGGDDQQIGYAIEVLQSRRFLKLLIDKHDILVPLIAAEGWDEQTGSLLIRERLYDTTQNKWVRDVKPPYTAEPSLEEAHKVWRETFSINRTGSFVSITVQHYSPFLTKEWVEIVVDEINAFVKTQEVEEAERSINYLMQELENTTVAESKTLLYDLIQRQTETIMLANVRDEYVFKTIDPPTVPVEKTGPSRALTCIVITLVGGFISCFLVLTLARLRN